MFDDDSLLSLVRFVVTATLIITCAFVVVLFSIDALLPDSTGTAYCPGDLTVRYWHSGFLTKRLVEDGGLMGNRVNFSDYCTFVQDGS